MNTYHTWEDSCRLRMAFLSPIASILLAIPKVHRYTNGIESQSRRSAGEVLSGSAEALNTESRESGCNEDKMAAELLRLTN